MVDADLEVDETAGAESPQAIVIEKRDPGHPKPNRRRKCEIKEKDPGYPKPNPSGYSFFFAEQHARLEPLHHRNNIEIGKIVEEHWNKLMEPEKVCELPIELMRHSKKEKLTSSYGALFISHHIVEEILFRLNAKTLSQCAFVCRDWNNFITSSNFAYHSSEWNFDSTDEILLIKVCKCKKSRANYVGR
ncbi:hypothetical protein K1719_026290 [Acacia pycnantha]|nr:hypothetical protein K1719_026290 [Acacia pycnantha]